MKVSNLQQQVNQALVAYLMLNMSVEELNQEIYKFNDEMMRKMHKEQGNLLFVNAYKHMKLLKIQKDLQKISRRKNAKSSEFCLKLVS